MAARNVYKLFVGNLPWTVSHRQLRHHFSQFGYVVTAQVVYDKSKGMSKGFGFVQFGDRGAYEAALNRSSQFLEEKRMDEFEEYSLKAGELEVTFNRAASYLQEIAATIGSEKLLFLYARYKQAVEGPCEVPKPGFFDFKGKQKWDAWKALGEMSKEDAMKEYIEGISNVDADWQIKAPTDSNQYGSSWVKVSSLAGNKEDDKRNDKDKNHFDWVKENDIAKVMYVEDKTLSEVDENGMTLLHWAADRGYVEITEALLEKGIGINNQDHEGLTALHYAASCGHQDVISILMSHGADKSIADSDGLLPVDCADEEVKDIFK